MPLQLDWDLSWPQDDRSTRPIAYASRTLQPHEKKYGATEMEGLGVVWAIKYFRPYLYGHPCEVYTDHSALTSLLNTPQPLAKWGMAIQELDLKIRHRPGCSNANSDAFVRAPLESAGENQDDDVTGVIANLGAQDVDLPTLQRQDVELEPFIKFLETGILPADGRTARLVATTASQYTIEEGVLYRVEFDGTLRLIPPRDSRETLFHSGVFGAHLGDAKVFSELRRSYWWYGMRSDISRWSRGCLVCATRQAGSAIRAPPDTYPRRGAIRPHRSRHHTVSEITTGEPVRSSFR